MIKLKDLLPESPFAVFVLAKANDGYAATTRAADRNEQGKIGLPGGKVDIGESPVQAATRESNEEGWQVTITNTTPIHKQLVDGKMVYWYAGENAVKLNNFKEKGRITPIVATREQILSSGYGNENLSNHINESIVKRVDIENLLPDKNNMEVAVDSLRKGMQSPSNSPIEVYTSEDKYIVADGHHRLLQAIINGESSVNVKVLDSEKPMSRNGTVALDFLDGDYYGLNNNLESGWLIKRL